MSLIYPNYLHSALNDRRPSPLSKSGADAALALSKLSKIAAAQHADPRRNAAMVGKMLQSGALLAGRGVNGNATLTKRAQDPRRYPVRYDDPEKALLNWQVAEKLAGLRGHAGLPVMALHKTVSGGIGSHVRALKAVNDRNLPPVYGGNQGPMISEQALEVLNSLPDVRVRNSVVNAIMVRPPLSNNDRYRYLQSVVSLKEQVRGMCDELGLDATALTDLLDRRVEWYDPNVQTEQATNPPPRASAGATIEDQSAWLDRTEPPVEPVVPGRHAGSGQFEPAFAGAQSTDLNPDFDGKALQNWKRTDAVLAKFYDHSKRHGDLKLAKAEAENLEHTACVYVKTEFDEPLRGVILDLHQARKRNDAASWKRIAAHPHYKAIWKAIWDNKGLSRGMRGAVLALIA